MSGGNWAVTSVTVSLSEPSIPSCQCGALPSLLTAQHLVAGGFPPSTPKAIIPAHDAWLAQRLPDKCPVNPDCLNKPSACSLPHLSAPTCLNMHAPGPCRKRVSADSTGPRGLLQRYLLTASWLCRIRTCCLSKGALPPPPSSPLPPPLPMAEAFTLSPSLHPPLFTVPKSIETGRRLYIQ